MIFFKDNVNKSKKGLYFLAITLGSALSLNVFAQNHNPSATSDLVYVNAVFSVSYNNTPASGDANLSIRNNQNTYDVNFSLKHSLLDATQSARFIGKSCDITPNTYQSSTNPILRSSTKESLNFNWHSKTATRQHNKDGKMQFDLTPDIYDPMSLYFKARCDLMAGKKQLSYPLIYKGRQTTHHYNVIGTEQIKTGIGEFDTLIVQRQRSNPDRHTIFYVAPALNYLVVKIHHRESSLATISMTLKHLDYQNK